MQEAALSKSSSDSSGKGTRKTAGSINEYGEGHLSESKDCAAHPVSLRKLEKLASERNDGMMPDSYRRMSSMGSGFRP